MLKAALVGGELTEGAGIQSIFFLIKSSHEGFEPPFPNGSSGMFRTVITSSGLDHKGMELLTACFGAQTPSSARSITTRSNLT